MESTDIIRCLRLAFINPLFYKMRGLQMDVLKYKSLPFKYKLSRFTLLLREAYPFLGEVCMRVEKYSNDAHVLAATDGYRLYLNEDALDMLPEESLNFVLLHELFHIILMHRYPKESQYYEKRYWNISFDLIVNWLIMSMEYELRSNNWIEDGVIYTIHSSFFDLDTVIAIASSCR